MPRWASPRATCCTLAGNIIFDMYANQDADFDQIQNVVRTFPGPAYGPINIRKDGVCPRSAAFGTIAKPTAGITPADVERLVGEWPAAPLLCLSKTRTFADLDYSPVAERTRRAIAIERVRPACRLGLVFSPRFGRAQQIVDLVLKCRCQATGIMFGETYAAGTAWCGRPNTSPIRQPFTAIMRAVASRPAVSARGHRFPSQARRHRFSPDGPRCGRAPPTSALMVPSGGPRKRH